MGPDSGRKINSITPGIPKSDLEIVLDKKSLFLYLKAGKIKI